jgi:hypothetical protein
MANTKISQLPLYSGTAADLRWFVMNNSGETETFKFSGYTSPFKSVGTNSRIINAWDSSSSVNGDNSMILGGIGNSIPSGNRNIIINGENATNNGSANCAIIGGLGGNITDGFGNGIFAGSGVVGGNWSAQVGGYNNIIGGVFNDRCFMGGGGNNTIGNSSNSALVATYNTTLTSGAIVFAAGTQDNTMTSAGNTFVLVGGGYNTVNNQNASAGNAMYSSYFCTDTTTNDTSVIGSSNNWFAGSRNCSQTGYGKHNWITNSYNSSISNNVSSDVREWFNKIDSAESSQLAATKSSQIIGGLTNVITSNDYSAIIGGTGNTMSSSISAANGKGNYIINSRNCKVEKDGQYQSNNVNYIACDNIQTENLNDVTFINCKNIIGENGGVATGTTVFRNTYTLGANIFAADTYVSTGATTNIVINPVQQDYIQIDTDGSTTYNIDFTFIDSAIYANIHLYINYVSGSTINFVGGGQTQWRWGNNLGAPVFSGTNRNIIVMSTWAGNDVWEVSRSMYM